MKALFEYLGRGLLCGALTLAATLGTRSVSAEPDPDGSPARWITTAYAAGAETGNGYAFKDAKAVEYKAGPRWRSGAVVRQRPAAISSARIS